jgi:hypothetical protein
MSDSIFDQIGSLAERLRDRLGREFGSCQTCGVPTRSHQIGAFLQCHSCHQDGEHVVLPDGGRTSDDRREDVERYVENHPTADRWEVLGQLGLAPAHQDLVDEVLEAHRDTTSDEDVIVDTIPARNYNETCANPHCNEQRVNDHPDSLCERHFPGDPPASAGQATGDTPADAEQAIIDDVDETESSEFDARDPDDDADAGDRDLLAEARQVLEADPDADVVDPATAGINATDISAAAIMGGDSPLASGDQPAPSTDAPNASRGVATPTSVLPLAQLEALSPAGRRRAARKRGLPWPDTDVVRDRLQETIFEAIRHEDKRVVDAPTSAGKSYTIDSTRWGARDDLTGDRPVVHLLPTRDARDEAAAIAREDGGSHFVFHARHEACPATAGDYDPDPEGDGNELTLTIDGKPASEWIQEICEGRGVAFSDAHRWLEQHNDQGISLPCAHEGNYDGECDAIAQWDDWRNNDYPLVIATHNFAHVPGLRNRTNMVIDEEPDFSHDLTDDRVKQAVAAFLEEVDAPVDTWEEFWSVATADKPGHRLHELVTSDSVDKAARRQGLVPSEYDSPHLEELKESLQRQPPREWYYADARAHILAGPIARAILTSEARAGQRRVGKVSYEPVRLDAQANDDRGWNREWLTVVFDSRNELRKTWSTPDVGLARSVIGLDAHPAIPIWQLQVHPEIQRRKVLDIDERQLWRRFERGLRVVQVGDATRPLASGTYFDVQQTEAVIEHLRDSYGVEFRTAITTSAVEDDVAEILRANRAHEPETMHYGEEKSRNDFADEVVGYVLGALDPGDGMVMDVVAALDLDANPERSDPDDCELEASAHCPECEGDGCHDCHGSGRKRARGREFIGTDAETAQAILASVREAHVAQSAGRYARNPDDPDATATVYVETDAMPPGFADVQVPGTLQTWTGKQSAVLEALREADRPRSSRDLADEAAVSKQHAYDTLERAAEFDIVDCIKGAGQHGATLYADDGMPTSGVVDLEADIVNDHVRDPTYTWSLAIRPPADGDAATNGGDAQATGCDGDVADGRDPPDAANQP